MEIIIQSPHFTVSSSLENYVNKKTSKFTHYNNRLISCDVLLKLDKSETEDNKICEIKVLAPRKELFANSKAATFEDAITAAVHSIEKQLRKQKTEYSPDKEKIGMPDDVLGTDTESGID